MPLRQLIEDAGTCTVRDLVPHLPWSHYIVYVLLKNVWHADWIIIAGIPGKDPRCWDVTDSTGKRHGGDGGGLDLRWTPRTFETNASKYLSAMLGEFDS